MVRRLAVYANGHPVYDEAFRLGVNIIRGANSSGKSTIADFLFFALGGDVSAWKLEAERCSEVVAEVLINGSPLTLRRGVSKSARQPMMLFWGDYEHARASAVDGWQVFSFQRSEEKQSFSQVLFRAMGFPEVRSDMENNITMHQILRLIYVDQLSLVENLMRTEHFDTPLTREAVRDLLFGFYDDVLYRCELKLRDKRRELETARTEFDSAMGVLGQTGHELDMDKVSSAIADTEDCLGKIQTAIDAFGRTSTAALSPGTQDAIRKLGDALVAARREKDKIETEIRTTELDIEDSREFITALENRQIAIENSISTREILGELPLTRCPHCLQSLEQVLPKNVCFLCKQPVAETTGRSQALRMRQELVFQQKESEALLSEKERRLTKLKEVFPAVAEKEKTLQREFDAARETATTSRDQELDALFVQRGMLDSRKQFLLMQAKAIGVLERLKSRITNLSSDIRRLEMEIVAKRKAQERKKAEAMQCVHRNVLELLRADTHHEEVFQRGQSVLVDFRKNAFAVDGQNQFSASSIAYLKNCIHYGVFFASLELDFFRYPRLIICDNMEDKGMQEARSQNFQRAVVAKAKTFDVEHQIIFTTSMIDSSLDNPDLCIGSKYTPSRKSLKFD